MGKKGKLKDECCKKYLKTGKHCKSCPLFAGEEAGKKKKAESDKKKKKKHKKKDKK